LNLDPKIFVLVPKNREFISLQDNIKKILILMMPIYSKNFPLGPLFYDFIIRWNIFLKGFVIYYVLIDIAHLLSCNVIEY